jgi:hypothetical protein
LGSNRLELDLGWRNRNDYKNNGYDDNTIKLTALYQWVWNIDGGFNWYAGVGGVEHSVEIITTIVIIIMKHLFLLRVI